MKNVLLLIALGLTAVAFGAASEITVSLKLDNDDVITTEHIRGEVDIANISPETIVVGAARSSDRFFIEVFRSADRSQLETISDRPFVADFALRPNEGQKLEVFLDEHYGLKTPGRYLAKPVLVHNSVRYEGQIRAFDVVPGMRIGGALQMFANRDNLRREFDLRIWSRGGRDHLFLMAKDSGSSDRGWNAVDLGLLMKITKPTISVMSDGVVVVIHRLDPDHFVRSEFWSVPDKLIFHSRALVRDPETAGSERVRELYRESGGIKPKSKPWWMFW